MPTTGSVTAKVKKRVIDTGRIFDILVQGESRSHTIAFAIPNETLTVNGSSKELKNCYFYLLFKRKGDETPQLPIDMNDQDHKSYDSETDTITVKFEPDSYFTNKNGSVDIQVFACNATQDFSTADVNLQEVAVWTTFNAQIQIAKSQLEDSQTIISEDLFTKEIEVLASYLDATEDARDLAKEWANKLL